MLTKKQLEILKVFKKDPFRSLSFSGLKKELGESSTSKLQNAIENFKKEDLIRIKKIGKTNLMSLNFDNNQLFCYLSIFNYEFSKMPLDVLFKIQESILRETEFFCLVVFGSYASGTEKKNSDLDVAVIVENEEIKKRVTPRIKSVERKLIKDIHEVVFSKSEFLEMLGHEEENVGKEIARNNLVFYGLINFYKLILRNVRWKV